MSTHVLEVPAPAPAPRVQFEYVLLINDQFFGPINSSDITPSDQDKYPINSSDITPSDQDKYGYVEVADAPYFHTSLDLLEPEFADLFVFWRADNTISAPFPKKDLKELELAGSTHIRKFIPFLYF